MEEKKACNCQQYKLQGVCEHTATNYPTLTLEEPQTESWEVELENEFGFWKDITITPRQAGDVARADLIQTYYRNTGERLKGFIRSLLSKTRQEERQRVVRIAEGTKLSRRGECVEPLAEQSIGYNAALSDLSSRVLEEGKE